MAPNSAKQFPGVAVEPWPNDVHWVLSSRLDVPSAMFQLFTSPVPTWQLTQVALAGSPQTALPPPWQVMVPQASPVGLYEPILPPTVTSTPFARWLPPATRLPAASMVAEWQSTHWVFAVASTVLTCFWWLLRVSSEAVLLT